MEREQGQGPGRWGGLMGLSRGGGEVFFSWQWEAFEDCHWGEWLQGGLYTGGPGGPDGQHETAWWMITGCFWRQGSQDVGVSKDRGQLLAFERPEPPGGWWMDVTQAGVGRLGEERQAKCRGQNWGPILGPQSCAPPTVPPCPGSEEGISQKG